MHTDWATSSYSNGANCLTTRWHKSSHSGLGGCVEARRDGTVQVRDSKDQRPDAPILRFAPQSWTAFIHAIKSGAIRNPQATP